MVPTPSTTPIVRVAHRDLELRGTIENRDFRNATLVDVGGRKVVFRNCDFSYAQLTRAYFPDAVFENCKFIGARFTDCNLRNARFSPSDFRYAQFRGTHINPNEVLSNLPEWENVRRELMMSHRKNAEGIGDMSAVKKYIRAELEAEREHYRKAWEGKEGYYSQKYRGVGVKADILQKRVFLFLDWFVWGHGEYPLQLLKSIAIALVVSAVVTVLSDRSAWASATVAQLSDFAWDAFLAVLLLFLGVPQTSSAPQIPAWLTVVVVLMRYIAFGLFVSMLFRRLSRR